MEDKKTPPTKDVTYWRVEGSLLNLSAVRPVAFFTWNSQSFSERWQRRGGMALLALIRPFLYAIDRIFATRVLHTLLRGISRDRLDFLGEEYFNYVLKPKIKPRGEAQLKDAISRGEDIVLVSQGLEHVMRPLAQHLGVDKLIANRLEFRDGLSTGRLLSPVIRPRQALAYIIGGKPDGRVNSKKLSGNLGFTQGPKNLSKAIIPSHRIYDKSGSPTVIFDSNTDTSELSVVKNLKGKHILLIGFTGFIAKVWLTKILEDIPDIGKVYLLIRRQRSVTAQRRFEKIASESPIFDKIHEKYGDDFARYLSEKVEVVEGDISSVNLGLSDEVAERLYSKLDIIVNSAGLTDFNPDLRQALSINVDGTVNIIDFMKKCQHTSLLHLSTAYVVGYKDGRISETLVPNYTPKGIKEYDAEQEYKTLCQIVRDTEAHIDSVEITQQIRDQVIEKHRALGKTPSKSEIETQVRKQKQRRIRTDLTDIGMERAKQYGWPNTYTYTKSLAESIIYNKKAGLSIAVVRPSIVETSTHEPFRGWNEGVNTSAPLSYLLGTFFRLLPSNEKKCLDIIPVDLVSRGMMLIAAALIDKRHNDVYQLATSAVNPCNMRRSIELTCLAHRKHYRAQDEFNYRLKALFETIPVSKERYLNMSAPKQKQVIQALTRILSPLPMMKSPLVRRERDLDRVEKLIELYEPFILHNEYILEAKNVEMLSACLPPHEKVTFEYDPYSIDWWEYWINIHIPALRIWSYPLIEGRSVENKSNREIQIKNEELRMKTKELDAIPNNS